MKIEWEQKTGKFQNGTACFLGKWHVGSADWHSRGSQSVPDETPYSATMLLPGLKDEVGRYATQAEAQARVEQVVKHWLKGAGITEELP